MGFWKNKDKKRFERGIILPTSISKQYLLMKHGDVGIFQTTFNYNTHNQDESYLYGDMYLDFDDKDNFDNAREDAIYAISYLKIVFGIEPNDLKIYFSGNKGVHVIVPKEILQISPNKKLNYIYKAIAKKIQLFIKNNTLDMQVYDNKRMFRIPNSMHETSKLYKILLSYNELRTLPVEEIKSLASSRRNTNVIIINLSYDTNICTSSKMYSWFVENYEKILDIKPVINKQTNKKINYTPPCIETLLNEGPCDGSRNNVTAILASFYKSRGYDVETAIEEITEWNSISANPLSLREIKATIYSMYRSDKSFGCSSIRNYYDECKNSKCKFFKQ